MIAAFKNFIKNINVGNSYIPLLSYAISIRPNW